MVTGKGVAPVHARIPTKENGKRGASRGSRKSCRDGTEKKKEGACQQFKSQAGTKVIHRGKKRSGLR